MSVVAASRIESAVAIARHHLRITFTHSLDEHGRCTCGRSEDPKNPCPPRTWGKHPIAARWQKEATDDEVALRDQFGRLRFEPNISIVLGEQSDGRYLVSIDIDDANRMAALENEHGKLPPTMRGDSPRGAHLFFTLPSGTPTDRLKNITGLRTIDADGVVDDSPGVDVKARGGQVVVVGKNGGGEYTGFDPTSAIAELPASWTLAILPAPRPIKQASSYTPQTLREDAKEKRRFEKYLDGAVASICGLLARTKEGGRNSATISSATRLFALVNGMHLPSAWGHVRLEVTRAAVAAGLSEREAEQTVANAEEYVTRTHAVSFPRELPPPREGGSGPVSRVERASERTERESGPAASGTETGTAGDSAAPSNGVELLDDNGKPAAIAENVARMMIIHPRGPLRYNVFAEREEWADGAPLEEVDAVRVQGWLMDQPQVMRVRASKEACFDGMLVAAQRNPVHPVQRYLRSLAWDGQPRIADLGRTHFAITTGDPAFVRAAMRVFLVGLVARALDPGCKHDTILILEGEQGARKSSALQALVGAEWFSSSHIDVTKEPNKYMALRGKWLTELAEYDRYGRRDEAMLKSYLSEQVDHYRPTNARKFVTRPRCGAFAGTTNQYEYHSDASGSRRELGVRCGLVDVEALRRDRDQIWAEAVAIYLAWEAAGRSVEATPWWLTVEEESLRLNEAEDRFETDPWEPVVAAHVRRLSLGKLPFVPTEDALSWCIPDVSRRTDKDTKRVASIMRRLGWCASRPMINGSRQRGFVIAHQTGGQCPPPVGSDE